MKNKKFTVVGLQLERYNSKLDRPKWVSYYLGIDKAVKREWPSRTPYKTFPTKLGAMRYKKKIRQLREKFLIEHFLNKNGKIPKQFKNKSEDLLSSWYKSTKYKIIQIGDETNE